MEYENKWKNGTGYGLLEVFIYMEKGRKVVWNGQSMVFPLAAASP